MNEYTAPQFDPAGLPMPRLTIELPGHRDFTTRVTVAIGDINYGGHLGNDAVLRLAQEAREKAEAAAKRKAERAAAAAVAKTAASAEASPQGEPT